MSFSVLTALETSYTNPTELSCAFEGPNEPTIVWYEGVNPITDDYTVYTESPGSWDGSAKTSTLAISSELATGETAITCKLTFADADVTDPIETATTVIKRGKKVILISGCKWEILIVHKIMISTQNISNY